MVHTAVNLGIGRLPLAERLGPALGIGVRVDNDVKATALGAADYLRTPDADLTYLNFGTGVSALTYLREIKLDIVRVDRAFVRDMLNSREDQTIIKHIVGLAHDLELIAIAEGVETEEQAQVLERLGVDLGQGYLFGRAEKPSSIANRLRGGEPDPNPEWDASAVLPGAHGGPPST